MKMMDSEKKDGGLEQLSVQVDEPELRWPALVGKTLLVHVSENEEGPRD